MTSRDRLLIFGGSFDPVHHGHLFIAQLAAEHLDAQQVLFLPTGRAPHRAPLHADEKARLRMLELAIADNPRFAIDVSDLSDTASGYTVDVLPQIQLRYPHSQLSFLVGEDAVTRSPWHHFDQVVASVEKFLIAPRDPVQGLESLTLSTMLEKLLPQTRARIEVLTSPRITISSTTIRERTGRGATIRYLVPNAVGSYIAAHGLYHSE